MGWEYYPLCDESLFIQANRHQKSDYETWKNAPDGFTVPANDAQINLVRARVYDFDPSWDAADGEDARGEYILRDIEYISNDGTAVLCMGARSHTYEIDTKKASEVKQNG